MRCISRYALVGTLSFAMTVDCTAACQLFQRCCRPLPCHMGRDVVCPPVSNVAIDVHPCDYEADPCLPNNLVEATSGCCSEDSAASPANKATEELVEDPTPAPAAAPQIPPAPLAVPETSKPVVDPAPLTPEPASVAPPAAGALGDRYPAEDSLFDTSPSTEAVPAEADLEPVPAKNDEDDLFDEPAADSQEEALPESTLPEPKQDAPKSGEAEQQSDTEEDDLFDTAKSIPAEEQQTEQQFQQPPEDPEVPSPAEFDDIFDPFGESTTDLQSRKSTLAEAGGLRSETNRTWTDRTSTYQCQARLVRVMGQSVVLQRSTGAQLIVPLVRLASDDLHFVHEQITALRVVRAHDAATEKLAVAWVH